MDTICLTGTISSILLMLFLCSTNACIRDSDCGDGAQYCCKAHCTSFQLRCSDICFRDEDCPKEHLCQGNACVPCSKRFNCELKSCSNDNDCPTSLRCSNRMCNKKKPPPKVSFTLLPFVIIIAVLGFALLVLCYTEGCWKEILMYFKQNFCMYGRIARDEQEADQRDFQGEIERGSHRHSNKSSIDPHHPRHETQNNLQAATTNSPNTSRNTRTISLTNEIRTMRVSENGPSRSQSPLTSCTSLTRQHDLRVPNSADAGSLPSLSDPHTTTRNSLTLPPTYCSLFGQEEEEEPPPPRYEEVVNNMNAFPVCIEMHSIESTGRTAHHNQETRV